VPFFTLHSDFLFVLDLFRALLHHRFLKIEMSHRLTLMLNRFYIC
jgi:hypothetical protein